MILIFKPVMQVSHKEQNLSSCDPRGKKDEFPSCRMEICLLGVEIKSISGPRGKAI